MTREQYFDVEKNMIKSNFEFENISLDEILEESQKDKKKGLLFPKEEVFALLLSDEF